MTPAVQRMLRRPERVLPVSALGLVVVLFLASPVRTGRGVESFDVYNALQGFAILGPLALAIGLSMVVGEFDLSVVGTFAVGMMLAVKTGTESAALGVLVAVVAGLVIGTLQGLVITLLRISSVPVTLAVYITLLGVAYALSNGLSVSYPNTAATLWVDETLGGVFSPRSLIALGLFLLAAVLLGATRLGRNLRAIGGDRRASRVVGVRVDRLLVGLFAASGGIAALTGALLGYSYASANPDPGFQPLLIATVAALLGGTSLAGGRGSAAGILAGALAVAFLAQTVTMSSVPDFTIQLFYAALLAVTVAFDSPGLRRGLARVRARRQDRSVTAT